MSMNLTSAQKAALAEDCLNLTAAALASFEAGMGTNMVSEQSVDIEAFEPSDEDVDNALSALF